MWGFEEKIENYSLKDIMSVIFLGTSCFLDMKPFIEGRAWDERLNIKKTTSSQKYFTNFILKSSKFFYLLVFSQQQILKIAQPVLFYVKGCVWVVCFSIEEMSCLLFCWNQRKIRAIEDNKIFIMPVIALWTSFLKPCFSTASVALEVKEERSRS